MDLFAIIKSFVAGKPGHDPIVLELDLNKGVITLAPANPVQAFRMRAAPTLRAIREALGEAAGDPQVAGLVIHTGAFPISAAEGDELAAAIRRFGEQKPTITWSESFGEFANGLMGYRLATAAHEIWLQPTGSLGLHGVHLDITLFRGTLAKVGIEPEFAQRKEYKSAAEQFAGTEVSQANREMMQRIADSILEDTIETIAKARTLDPQAVRHGVDNSPLTASQAVEANLVDRLGYRDQVYAELRSRYGRRNANEPAITLRYSHRYGKGPARRLEEMLQRTKPAIAVVSVQGAIHAGPPNQGPGGPGATTDAVGAHLREASRDDKVKAVVLRIDSPGGSYIASDAIRREVLQVRRSGRPVVASMGNAAASGGYFVAMGSDEIVANPTTLTGSIGVLAGKFVTAELVDKIGLIREQINAGARAGALSAGAKFSDEDWAVLNEWLDEVYDDFVTKAAEDRKMDREQLEQVARGRVWTGTDAHAHGLVDHLGGMGLALQRAADLAKVKLDAVQVRPIPVLPWLEQLKPAESSESGSQMYAGAPLLGGPEALLTKLAFHAGIELPGGVLSLPWHINIR